MDAKNNMPLIIYPHHKMSHHTASYINHSAQSIFLIALANYFSFFLFYFLFRYFIQISVSFYFIFSKYSPVVFSLKKKPFHLSLYIDMTRFTILLLTFFTINQLKHEVSILFLPDFLRINFLFWAHKSQPLLPMVQDYN